MKFRLFRILSLLIAASAIGILYNFISPNKLPLIKTNVKNETKKLEDIKNTFGSSKDIYEINAKEAYSLQSKMDIVFIDARDQWDYSKKRIMNSINMPEYKYEPNLPLVKSLKKDGLYIIYCSSEDCNLSKMLAYKLKKQGFKYLLTLKDGIEGWIDNAYPIEGE